MLFFARHMSTVDWAIFSFASGFMLVLQGIQLSVVVLPMITFSKGQVISTEDQTNWTWLNRTVMLSMVVVSLLTGLLISKIDSGWFTDSFLFAAVLIPPAFTYEYLRRRLILANEFTTLSWTAIAYALGVVIGIYGYYKFALPPIFAALTYWPGMLLAIYVSRVRDPVRLSAPAASWLKPLVSFAPSSIGSSMASAGYNFAILALLGKMSGPVGVALFNATRMVIQPVNSLIGAVYNLDLPRAAKAYAEGGSALVEFLTRSIVRLTAIGGLYLVVLCLLAGPVLMILFGKQYSSESMVFAWSVVGLLMLIAMPLESVFYITRQTHLLFANRVQAAVIGCLWAYWAIPLLGAQGAVLSIAAGWLVALLGGMFALWRTRTQSKPKSDG
jgi:O-antigen/teichoic acid export membrane protein